LHAQRHRLRAQRQFRARLQAANDIKMPAQIVIMNTRTGKVVANVAGIGGADEINLQQEEQPVLHHGAHEGRQPAGRHRRRDQHAVQKIPVTGGNPHSVTSDQSNGHVFLPVGAIDGGCSCIQVYGPVR